MVPPRAGALLAEVAETSDLESALWRVLSEYIDLKTESLQRQQQEMTRKWGMSFEAFSERFDKRSASSEAYSYQVESDFWEWEKVETLLEHYRALRARWM
jgi:hypothetical protein